MKPKRIQRKRTKGWRMPSGCVYVGRPTKWGNPYQAGEGQSPAHVVQKYRAFLLWNREGDKLWDAAIKELRGKDLACWCPLGKPCHADVLLELANK